MGLDLTIVKISLKLEAAAGPEGFLEKEPHPIVTDGSTYTVNDPEFARRLHERYCLRQ